MSTSSAVGLSGDVRLLRTLKMVLPALNMKVIAPPAPVPSADAASPAEIRLALIDADYPDTAAVLKWLEPGRRIPVILMWGAGAPLPRSLRGAAAILSKPLDPNKLRAAIELVLPDWEEPQYSEPCLADVLDLFETGNRRDDSPALSDPQSCSAAPAVEEEIDRLLGPALAELGIPPKRSEAAAPMATSRSQDPPEESLPPRVIPTPSVAAPPEKKPLSEVQERVPLPTEIEAADAILTDRRPLHPEPMPEDAEFLCFPFEPSTIKKRYRAKLMVPGAGLAVIALVGATYLGFGGKTAKYPPPGAATPAAAMRVMPASAPADAAAVEKIPISAPSPGRTAAEEPKPQVAKPEPATMSLPVPGAQRRSLSNVPEKDQPAPIEAPAPPFTRAEPVLDVRPELNFPLQIEPEKKDPAAKAEAFPAASKTAAGPAPGPRPIQRGDLIDLAAVDILPVLLNSVEPAYPPLAYRYKEQAKVALSVLISEKGEVVESRTSGDPSVDMGFVKAAQRAVQRWSYSPALKNGVAVRVWKPVVIDFKIR